jgi:predicted Rossmann-fold nucleotide-binding protein
MRRVLVCGGRTVEDYAFVSRVLAERHETEPFSLLIAGGASGADGLAVRWAKAWGVPVKEYLAEWKRLGRMAGPIRNRRMLEDGQPDLVIAFPGGRGTANMVKLAESKGVFVVKVKAT